MCVLCIVQNNRDSTRSRTELRDMHLNIAAKLSGVKGAESMKQFYIDLLRKTANDIESTMFAERAFTEGMKVDADKLKSKVLKVEMALLAREAVFYTDFGMVMPDSVRVKLKLELWDSLEEAQQEGQEDD